MVLNGNYANIANTLLNFKYSSQFGLNNSTDHNVNSSFPGDVSESSLSDDAGNER